MFKYTCLYIVTSLYITIKHRSSGHKSDFLTTECTHIDHAAQCLKHDIERSCSIEFTDQYPHKQPYIQHACPPLLFNCTFGHLSQYNPLRIKKDYDKYHKITSVQQLLAIFPNFILAKDFAQTEGTTLHFEVFVIKSNPVRLIYSTTKANLLLMFWWEPQPRPED